MNNAEILIYQTREGKWKARVRNRYGTDSTGNYATPRGALLESDLILNGVSADDAPCLNPKG